MNAIAPLKIGGVSIDMEAFAINGNAILGTRESGKSYNATGFGEALHDRNIPFTAFDPSGVWRFLRVPGPGRNGKGFPVVVAGGEDGDLPLTVSGAPQILRAAMANGVSLVFDLFDAKLSKADWRRIVHSCMELMLYENKRFGLRHVFLEEAPEFAPQRVGPGHAQVYEAVERMVRIGGNSGLGVTLIGQRSAEINKAVLELCENLYLHRQRGKNSLEGLEKWLIKGNVGEAKAVMETLPSLPTGECWAWLGMADQAVRLKMPPKRSLHPDRRAMRGTIVSTGKKAVNVTAFVDSMRGSLKTIEEEAKANDPKLLKAEIASLKAQLAKAPAAANAAPAKPLVVADTKAVQAAAREGYSAGLAAAREVLVPMAVREGVRLGFQAVRESVDKALAGVRGGVEDAIVNKFLTDLKRRPNAFGKMPSFEAKGPLPILNAPPPASREERPRPAATVQGDGILAKAERTILVVLAQSGACNRNKTALRAGYSVTSGGFRNALSKLRVQGFMDDVSGKLAITDAGRAALGEYEPLPTGAALIDYWLRSLGKAERTILAELTKVYPNAVDRAGLADASGYSVTSGGFRNALSKLRTLELIEGSSELKASDDLMGD